MFALALLIEVEVRYLRFLDSTRPRLEDRPEYRRFFAATIEKPAIARAWGM